MGERCGARLHRGCADLCDACPRASSKAVRRQRGEDRVGSGVAGSGERPHRRPAGSDRSGGVRRARRGDAASLRSADVLAGCSNGPCRVDPVGVRDHRIDAASGSAPVCQSGRDSGFRRFGHARGLGRRDHGDRVESGRHRSPTPRPRRRRCLRARRSRVVASPRPLDPHDRAPIRVLHRLRHCVVAAADCCGNGGRPSPRWTAPERSPARLSEGRPPNKPRWWAPSRFPGVGHHGVSSGFRAETVTFRRSVAATDMAGAARSGRSLRRHLRRGKRVTPTRGHTGGNRVSPREASAPEAREASGAYRDRTGDLRLAKPALSQLS
jgi:hypothetical protein